MAFDLDEIVDELYALAPDAFTAARDQRAAEVRKAGERDLAAAVKKLRRPTVSAWMANALVRRHGDDVKRLLDLAASLRDAQDRLAGDELRQLSQGRHQVVTALARQGRDLGQEAGVKVSEAAERELEGTLEAAMSDPAAADALRSGCLTTALRYAGLGFGDPGDAVAVVRRGTLTPTQPPTQPPTRPPTRAPAPTPTPVPEADDEAARAAAHARAGAEVESARTAVDDARAHAETQEAELVATREQQDLIRDQIRALRRQIEDLEDEQARTSRHVDDIARTLGAAERDVRAAERRLSQAEAALQEMEQPGPRGPSRPRPRAKR